MKNNEFVVLHEGEVFLDGIFAIIPFWNGREFLSACLSSIQKASSLPVSIVVVDDASGDDPPLEICKGGRGVTLLQRIKNGGFGATCNLGAKWALDHNAKKILLFNQDVIALPGCVDDLCKACEKENSGVVAPIMLEFPTGGLEEFFIRWYLVRCPSLISDAVLGGALKESYKVPEVSGAVMAFRGDLIKEIGLFDPLFPMYGEDVDFCRRVRSHGKNCLLVPRAIVRHHHSATRKDSVRGAVIAFQRRWAERLLLLKDPAELFPFLLAKFLKDTWMGFLDGILSLKFRTAFRNLFADLKVLLFLGPILRSRQETTPGFSK